MYFLSAMLGECAAADADRILLGWPRYDGAGINNAGAALLFEWTGTVWQESLTVTAADAQPADLLGEAVGLHGDSLAAGGYGCDVGGNANQGAVYVCDLVPPPPTWVDLGHGLAGSQGIPQLEGDGAFVAGQTVSLLLSGAKPFALCWLVLGLTQLEAPFKGGVLVPAPDLLLLFTVDGLGEADVSTLWPSGVPAGDTFFSR